MSAVLPPSVPSIPAGPGAKPAAPGQAATDSPFAALLAVLGAGVVPVAPPLPLQAPVAAPPAPVILPATPPVTGAAPVVPGTPAPAPEAAVPPPVPESSVTEVDHREGGLTTVTEPPKPPKPPKDHPARPILRPSERRSPEPTVPPADAPEAPATPVQPKADAPAAPATPATPAVPAGPPAHSEAPRHETPQVREIPLPRAPHAVAQTIHLAQVKGVSHARLNLRPAELGGIEVRLASDAGGLHATVVADSPQAAALLQSATEDLRRQLERNGVTVASLDISAAQPGTTSAGNGDAQPGRQGGSAPQGDGRAAEDEAAPETAETLTLPDGVLVDVLA